MRPYLQRIIAALLVLLVLSQMVTFSVSRREFTKGMAAADGEKSELVLWYTDAKLNDFILEAAKEYEEETGIHIHPQLISAVDYVEKISEATLIQEQGPDLFVAGSDLLQKILYAGLVSEQVSYEKAELEEIPQKAFNAATCDGKLTGYPFYYESCFLLYNKNYAEDWPRNIDQILEYADNFESTEENSQIQSIFKWDVSDIFYNYFFIGEYVGMGGPYGDDKDQLNLSAGKVIDCLEYYQNLNSFFAIDGETVHSEDVIQEFIDGKIVFTIAKTDAIERLEEAVGDGEVFYGIGDVPNLSDELLTRGLSVTNTVVVNSYSSNTELAHDFAHFLSYEKAEDLYAQTGKVSVCKRVNAGNEDWERVMAQYEGSVEIPKIIEMSNYWILMEIAFANIWNGADITEEITKVVSQVNMQMGE